MRESEGTAGHDDYALGRMPREARHNWITVATQRFGQLSCLSQFMLGATLGYGMTFWDAFLALTLGAVILEIVAIFIGIAGQREGLGLVMLSRWAGFGRHGSSLLSLVITVSLVGWFAVQNAVFATGIQSLLGGLQLWAWALICGLAVTMVVAYGISAMAWLAYVTVPAFLLLAGWSILATLQQHSLAALLASPAPGPKLSLTEGATLVAGGFIIGAVVTPDMSRFNRSPWDVVKQTVISITFGEYLIGLIAVLLAHAVRSADVVAIIVTTTNAIGTIILVTSTMKINDWNLYSASLGGVNFLDAILGRAIDRRLVTLAIGLLGTLLSIWAGMEQFTPFLIILGTAIPPVGGIIVTDYFILRRNRTVLDASAGLNQIPGQAEGWNLPCLLAWVAGLATGLWLDIGIPSLNALIVSGLTYWLLSRLLQASSKQLTSHEV
ncbi:allantoin permease [Labrys sp. WJW]|uniref:purine-cytosine permease family protein n=1 Tax=Labrys sp. WJW TaxID=1737983 RepID=UPI0008374E2B|nr:cytosine permease [Labrys sp. WJW]OCC05597.1 allantoin permease [Labrys sp. WJW]